MRSILLSTIIIATLYTKVSGLWISTMLPLPNDLELLIDSMYDDGYTAEYLTNYDEVKGEDLPQSDLLLGWERPRSMKIVENPLMNGIIDPDRDGVRNLPPLMNYSKAIFVPNEIDYKIRPRHRYHSPHHSGRMGGTLQKQIENYRPEDEKNLEGRNNVGQKRTEPQKSQLPLTVTPSKTPVLLTSTNDNLDFLLPIPELEILSTKKLPKPLPTKLTPLPLTTPPHQLTSKIKTLQKMSRQSLSNNFKEHFKKNMRPNIPPVISVNDKQNFAADPSVYNQADKFQTIKNDEIFKTISKYLNYNNRSLLDKLHKKLTKIYDNNYDDKNCLLKIKKSEEEKELNEMNESGSPGINIKKHQAMRPIVSHLRVFHPGHRNSYIANVGPLTRHTQKNKD